MEISIGPVPTNLGEKRLWQFYEEVAELPAVKRVYVGEVACTKRDVIDRNLLLKIATLLEGKNKEVVFSSYALPTDEQDLERNFTLARTVKEVEVNNFGLLQLLQERFYRKSFIIGPFLNCYNLNTVDYLSDLGADHFVLDPDVEVPTMVQLAQARRISLEVIGYGHLPLGFSWRCYTAFAFGEKRATCRFICYRTHEMALDTQEGAPLFLINGPSVASLNLTCLLYRINDLKRLGIRFIRILPLPDKVAETVEVFDQVIKGELTAEAGMEKLFTESAYQADIDFCCLGGARDDV